MCPIDRYRLFMYKYMDALSTFCGVNYLSGNYRITFETVSLQGWTYAFGLSICYSIFIFDADTKIKNVVIMGIVFQVSTYNLFF